MKTIYIAYDGKEFDSQGECEIYERIHTTDTKGFKAANHIFKTLTFEEVIDGKDFDYIKATKEQLLTIDQMIGLDIYLEDGEYVYDWDDGKWVDLNERIEYFENKLEELRKVKKVLEEE